MVIDLPFDRQVGAAALVRGGAVLVVFDRPKPLDLAALRKQPAFAGTTVDVLPASTLLTLHPPAGLYPRLSATQDGWRVTLEARAANPEPLTARPLKGGLEIEVARPGRVVAISDPLSGAALLVGTVHRGGDAVAEAQLAPEFALLPTIAGVAVEPLSDRLQLEVGQQGFTPAPAAPSR